MGFSVWFDNVLGFERTVCQLPRAFSVFFGFRRTDSAIDAVRHAGFGAVMEDFAESVQGIG
jgi:hypothetical protein